MNLLKRHVMALALMVMFAIVNSWAADAPEVKGPSAGRPVGLEPASIRAPVGPLITNWVEQELLDGRSVVLTNSYLFQLMKGAAQEAQKEIEEKYLLPLLRNNLKGWVEASTDKTTALLFAVPLLLLVDDPGLDVPKEAAKRADVIRSHPLFTPRGHYTDSEELKKYFRAMQYLAKATVDVAIRKNAFPFPAEMLYPFETAETVRVLFSDPANDKLVQDWLLVHRFYSQVNGDADLPTFADLQDASGGKPLTREAMISWAKAHALPRINPEAGVGIQPLGERQSLHQEVIDDVKRKLIKSDTPRQEIAQRLAFRNLLAGGTVEGQTVQGLAPRLDGIEKETYYAESLAAISRGAGGWESRPRTLNFFAAALTSLAEQTALMTKTSILVRKSTSVKKIRDGLKLYFERDSHEFLNALASASRRMTHICSAVAEPATGRCAQLQKVSTALAAFAVLAQEELPLVTGSAQWQSHGDTVLKLARRPTVIVDIFQVKERSGAMYFLQWGIAPFEEEFSIAGEEDKPRGLAMIFFEAWNDQILPESKAPLTNLQWQGRILEGKLEQLPSIVRWSKSEEVK